MNGCIYLRSVDDENSEISRKLFYYSPELYYETGMSEPTSFFVVIEETGWIYDVCLVVNDNTHIKTIVPFVRASDYYKPNVTYSIFNVLYTFNCPQKCAQIYWKYTIDGKTYTTTPIQFEVVYDLW